MFPSSLNDTNVVLIPKINSPDSIRDLCLISLCNVFIRFWQRSQPTGWRGLYLNVFQMSNQLLLKEDLSLIMLLLPQKLFII